MNSPSFTRRDFLKTSALALPLIAAGCATTTASAKTANDFVTVRNRRFELRGKPYAFVGTNLWYGCYLGDPKLSGGRARLVRELDRLQKIGVTNLRLLAGSEQSALAGSGPRGITRGPGDVDEDLLAGLDFCLAEMGQRNLRGVLYLTNYWQWSGGMAQYVNWVTGEPIPDPDRPEIGGTWSGFMNYSARFYRTPKAMELFRNYIAQLINRRNTCNGKLYKHDPAIMAWELANEPRPGTDDTAPELLPPFYDWVDQTARYIHSLDGNHLVTPGTEGLHGCLHQPEVFLKAYGTPAIDYVNVHVWVKNWSWLTEPRLGAQYEQAVAQALAHVEEHVVLATDTLRKPLTMEEFGIARDGESLDPASGVTMRNDYYRKMFGRVAVACQAGRALQGVNFWAWSGEGRPRAHERNAAEVFMGDPFSEPQGLNSVLDTDLSTLKVIAECNTQLRGQS